MRTAGSANGVGRIPNANQRFVSICAWVGPNNAQGDRLHDAIRDAVNWVNGWGVGTVGTIVPHGPWDVGNINTACPGNELRNLIARGAFRPGQPTQPPQPPRDWFDMATENDLRNALRTVLNEGTGTGQQNWASTNRNILSIAQGNVNRIGAMPDRMREVLNEAAGQGTDGTWRSTFRRIDSRTGDLINMVRDLQNRVTQLERQQNR